MRISRIELKPWAGRANASLELKPGLNVLLGPNDTGKSSLFHAIDRVLLTPARLAKVPFAKEIAPWIPVGGDTARVELSFHTRDGKTLTLRKVWGARPSAELTLSDGTTLLDDEKIQGTLEAELPLPPRTFRTLLLSRQSALQRTLEELTQEPEALRDLGDVLRKAVLQTDGVSVEGLRSGLRDRITQSLSHWDEAAQRPEGGRGLQNPWKREVGRVLAAYYRREELQERLNAARRSENELDRLQGELRRQDREIRENAEFIARNQAAYRALEERRTVKTQLGALLQEIGRLTEDFSFWSRAEVQLPLLEQEIQSLRASAASLEEEARQAARALETASLRERHSRARTLKRELELIQKNAELLKKLPRTELDKLLQAHQKVERLRASLSAGKLKVSIVSEAPGSIQVRRDLEAPGREELRAGSPLLLKAGGRISLQAGGLEIRVESGEGDFETLERSVAQSQGELQSMLAALGVQNVEEARQASASYEAQREEWRAANQRLKDVLGNDSLEELDARVAALGELTPTRAQAQILSELKASQSRLGSKEREAQELGAQLALIKRRHQTETQDALVLRLGERSSSKATLEQRLASLPALPSEVSDEVLFLERYRQCEARRDSLAQSRNQLILGIAEVKQAMPDESVQELEPSAREAGEEFQRELEHARSLRRVHEVVERIAREASPAPFAKLTQAFEERFSAITGGKYARPKMEAGIPEAFDRKDGARIPYASLSAGMRDAVALCLKLSISEHLLEGRPALLLLDDPLVNLDPERARAAAEQIRAFSEKAQILLFTCHPAHAELLGGNRMELH